MKAFKLCIDPGHGMDSAKRGVYDTGAVSGDFVEASIALVWGLELAKACTDRGVQVWMTRDARADVAPLATRVARAEKAGCTHLLSLHVNDADDMSANGVETLYWRKESLAFAKLVHGVAQPVLGLRDRGVKLRPNLAVLRSGTMRSALLEVGFIGNKFDRLVFTDLSQVRRVCQALALSFEELKL